MSFERPTLTYVRGDQIPPANLYKSSVEHYAEKVARIAQFEVGGDPADVVEKFGGSIHLQDFDDWMEGENGSVFVHGPSDFDICLPVYTSPLRDRFTVGHELGHYFLHSRQGEKPIVAYRRGSTRIEWEANWFAAALLMPEREFRQACKNSDDLAFLASQFGVSQDAARVRKDALQI